jgi:two-component system NtrC family sensor kinase
MKLLAHYFDRITESLFVKLVVIFGILIISGSGLLWYISSQNDKKDLMGNSVAFISSISEMIHQSIKHHMLLNNRADIQRALESVGATESITRVSLFDRNGIIHYSSDRGTIGSRADKDFSACIGCHKDPSRPRETLIKEKQWTIYTGTAGHRVLSFIEPIYNEPGCYTAQCHVHNKDQRVLGVLMTNFSLYSIDRQIKAKMMSTGVFTLLSLTAGAAMLYLIFWSFVISPIKVLSKGMEKVTSGDLSQMVPHPSKDEIGKLARTFNIMIAELKTSRQKLEKWTQTLEQEVEKKTAEIKKTQSKLIEAEKLAALGRLTADIAHEIRNPLSALGGFGRRLQKISVGEKEKEYSEIIVSEVARLEHILKDILSFSRDVKFNFERATVTDVVRESIAAFAELCAEHSVKIVTNFNSDLPILFDRIHAGQAIGNLLSNAIDAMSDGGTLTVSTTAETANNANYLAVHISDTGTGIPANKLHLIFEPFLTTKISGYGSGLGLSITKKIIEEHGGFIQAENNKGQGITVSLYFPCQTDEDLNKTPCWEFMKCGRDVNSEMKCPAYPNFGRTCWVVAGTFCEGKAQGTFAQKYQDCKKCEFYNKAIHKEI